MAVDRKGALGIGLGVAVVVANHANRVYNGHKMENERKYQMTIAEEIIHELKRLRIKANQDVKAAENNYKKTRAQEEELKSFRGGLSMAVRVANQINNRRTRKTK